MNHANEFDIPPECAPTLVRIQRVLDGEAAADLVGMDLHLESCRSCRERLAAARLLVMSLAGFGSVRVPSWLPGAIVAGIDADRRARTRRRVLAFVGGLAAAAAIVVAVWITSSGQPGEMVQQNRAPAPALPPKPGPGSPGPAPNPQPIRINEELAKASSVLRDSSQALAEPLESAPKVLGELTDAIFRPASLAVSTDLEPARQSLADIPDAARAGLEPVTGSAQKALDRLLRDVSGMQPGKPKS